MKKILSFTFLIVLVFVIGLGCTERVPPGFVGMVMLPGGLTGEALGPGNHSCWNRDRMTLIPTKEVVKTEQLSVLCADDLNFKFDLKVRARLKAADSKSILDVLNRQGANIKWAGDIGTLPFDGLYKTYVGPAARPIARSIVSKYETVQIRGAREEITKAIQIKLLKAIKRTPIEITLVATSNFDYPKVITEAVQKKRKKEVQIQEEKANQAIELLKVTNRLKIAQEMKAVRAAEAEADAVAIQILGKALTKQYLSLKRIERDTLLYKRVAPGDKVIITGDRTIGTLLGVNK